jgi:hypothetical protein
LLQNLAGVWADLGGGDNGGAVRQHLHQLAQRRRVVVAAEQPGAEPADVAGLHEPGPAGCRLVDPELLGPTEVLVHPASAVAGDGDQHERFSRFVSERFRVVGGLPQWI